LFDSEFCFKKKKKLKEKEGQPEVINKKIKEPHNAATYPFGDPYSYIQKHPKQSPSFCFFKRNNKSHNLFRRSIPNCGASKGIVRDQKSSPVSNIQKQEKHSKLYIRNTIILKNITHCYECQKRIPLAVFFTKRV
jgi:hypothetical protein